MKDPLIKELRLKYYRGLKRLWSAPKDSRRQNTEDIREALKLFDPDWDQIHWSKIGSRIRDQHFKRLVAKIRV